MRDQVTIWKTFNFLMLLQKRNDAKPDFFDVGSSLCGSGKLQNEIISINFI